MPRRAATTALAILAAALAAAPLAAQSLLPLSDYQVIIDRRPFGDLAQPNGGAQDAAAAQAAALESQAAREQEAMAKQIDLVAVNITLRGTVSVGFVDKGAKPPESHYLAVGETESGFTVDAADYAAETATISKDGVRVTLKLGAGVVSESPAGEGEAGAAAANGGNPAPPDATQAQRAAPRLLRRPGASGGYRRAVRERRRAEDAAVEEMEAQRREDEVSRLRHASDAAAAKREHEMNYQLLLEGKEPVSEIHLTPEEERELEKRGLLPPADAADAPAAE